MEERTKLGMNRTGIQMSPLDIKKMVDETDATIPTSSGDETVLGEVRQAYMTESQGLGSVPVPGSMRGMMSSGMEAIKGHKPQVFVDKLGERLAFERAGTRLYDGLLMKCMHAPQSLPAGAIDMLRQFRDEEARHFHQISEAIVSLGADPTAQTPCADLVGVQGMGLMQAMNDPRTTVMQCLNTILIAELTDNAGWEVLIELARSLGHDELADQFAVALEEEQVHLTHVREWLRQSTLSEALQEPLSNEADTGVRH